MEGSEKDVKDRNTSFASAADFYFHSLRRREARHRVASFSVLHQYS